MNREYLHSAAADESILFSWAEARSFQVSKLIIVPYKGFKLLVSYVLMQVYQALQNLPSIKAMFHMLHNSI